MQNWMSPAAADLMSALDPDIQEKMKHMQGVSAAIEVDRSVRMWKISANKVNFTLSVIFL